MKQRRSFTPPVRAHLARRAIRTAGYALGTALALGCGGKTDGLGAAGSETHFLLECSETCAPGLDCIAGVCTTACSNDGDCSGLASGAVCSAQAGAAASTCDVRCDVAADCVALGAGHACVAGSCRSATLGAELGATAPPEAFDVLELRRIGELPAGAGSDCDPLLYTTAIFVDLPARQVSWQHCSPERGSDRSLSLSGQWPLAEDDARDLLVAYGQLSVSDEPTCNTAAGNITLDLTSSDGLFSYADAEHSGCPVQRLGRTRFIGDLAALYSALGPIVYDRPRGLPREP